MQRRSFSLIFSVGFAEFHFLVLFYYCFLRTVQSFFLQYSAEANRMIFCHSLIGERWQKTLTLLLAEIFCVGS